MELVKLVDDKLKQEVNLPDFRTGDNITLNYKIKEGDKERIQAFRGDVIKISGAGANKTFTVRKMSSGVGVERIFPLYSPFIESVEVNRKGKVRRSKLYYLRELVGKKARIKERQNTKK